MAPVQPPWPPQASGLGVQSRMFCSESTTSSPVAIAWADSIASAAEKDQQDPQPPWLLTGVTTPCSRQSQRFGSASSIAEASASESTAPATSDTASTRSLLEVELLEVEELLLSSLTLIVADLIFGSGACGSRCDGEGKC